jgi:CheY-like chemotaxis protein
MAHLGACPICGSRLGYNLLFLAQPNIPQELVMNTHRGFPNGTSAKPGASKTILCVDDEESGLFLRKLLLESAGFSVLTASNGKDGLAVFASRSIDAVIVDYSMPEMDGGVFSGIIKQLRPQTPVIMLTAYPLVSPEAQNVIDAMVQKGEDPSVLLNKLESLIKIRSHSHPELQQRYVVFADGSRRYLDCSDGVCLLLGYPRMELTNMSIDQLSYIAENVPALFEHFKKERKLEGQHILRHKTGKPVTVTYRSYLFSDGCMAAVWEPFHA